MAIVGVLNGHNSVAIGTATDEMVMQVIHGSRIALHLDVWSSSVQSYTRARTQYSLIISQRQFLVCLGVSSKLIKRQREECDMHLGRHEYDMGPLLIRE